MVKKFTLEDIYASVIREEVTSDYDFYLLDSMHSYVNYFNPLNLIDNGITVGRANYSENRRHIGPECRSNQDWRG
jgi:hypothetical protein